MFIAGIDDSGRGPMFGPMVLCCVVVQGNKVSSLKSLGVKDSKLLTPQKREALYSKIINLVDRYSTRIVCPAAIDAAVNSPSTNLNWLEADNMASLINELKPDHAVIDCPSPNKEAFTEYLEDVLNVTCKLQCEHKADVNYPAVSAASIIAKVIRDREIQKIKEQLGKHDIGSGYPTDPKSKEFLKNYWNVYPHIFRTSWASYKRIANANSTSK